MIDEEPGHRTLHAAGQPSAGRARTGETVPTTFSSARAALTPALTVLTPACALLAGGVALAGLAAAIEDPRRPAAEVTHGPSCGPAVIRVAVTNGTEPHRVALVFDGTAEQQDAELAAGEQAELTSADIDWGRTVDVSLTVTDTDGTAEDPIQFGTYTRPSAEDCAAVTPTTTPTPEPETPQPSSAAPMPSITPPSSSTAPSVDPSTPSSDPAPPAPPATSSLPSPPETSSSTSPAPTSSDSPGPTSAPPSYSPPGDQSGPGTGGQAGASAASVSPGGVLTVRATGFEPGEPVIVSMVGVADPLTTVTAAADGSVKAVVQIPRGVALGMATV